MFKGSRTQERAFAIPTWMVPIVLAAILIGLGQPAVGDLARMSSPLQVEAFINPAVSSHLVRQTPASPAAV